MKTKKLKKPITILMIIMLSVTAFSGCGVSDVGYANLYMEASNIKSLTLTADMSFELDFSAMYSYSYIEPEPFKLDMDISGDIMRSAEDIYLDLKINYGVNDTKKPYECNILMTDNALYVPVKDLIDIAVLSFKYENDLSDKMCTDFKAALEKELPTGDYALLIDFTENHSEYGPDVPTLNAKADDIKKIFAESITKAFFNLESGLTQKAANGYTLEVTPDNAVAFADDLIKYISANKKAIYKEAADLAGKLAEMFADDESLSELDFEALSEIRDNEQGFYDAVDDMVSSYNEKSDFDKDEFKLTVKGSYFKNTISESGGAYTSVCDAVLNYKGEKFASVKGQVTVKPANVSTKTISRAAAAGIESIVETVDRVYKKVNPAKEIEISWYNGSDWTRMQITLAEGSNWDYTDSNIENGTMYLPMRQICEWFGEDVIWDNDVKKAYIVRGADMTEMAGKIVDGHTLVKIRDFEKLGYTVDYEYDKDYKRHTVVIKK